MESPRPPALDRQSLDQARHALRAPERRRVSIWTLLLAATLAAVAGVATAGVMILGPGDGLASTRIVRLH